MNALGARARHSIRRGMADARGATAIEYALLASLIALAIIGGVTATGHSVSGLFDGVVTDVATAFAKN